MNIPKLMNNPEENILSKATWIKQEIQFIVIKNNTNGLSGNPGLDAHGEEITFSS